MEREKTVEKGRGGNRTDGFVHAQDQTTRLHRRLNRVDLHKAGLPHKSFHVVSDAFVVEVDTGPRVSLAMLHT